jgi:serralysin
VPTIIETSVDWGTQVSGTSPGTHNVITYYFEPGGQKFDDSPAGAVSSVALNNFERAQFLRALATYSTFLDVTFAPGTAAGANFKLLAYSQPGDPILGAMGPPGTGSIEGFGAFNAGGAGWFEQYPGIGPLEQGGFAFVTMIHELGHGFGLAHPHDNGGGSTIFPGVDDPSDLGDFGLNQGVFTTMSYNAGWQTSPSGQPQFGAAYGYQGTPMAIDIAVLQAKYGANMSYHTGNDTYALSLGNRIGTFYSCIWDAGGTDQIVYAGAADATIDLRAATLQAAAGGGGYVSYAKGIFGGYTIARGVTIENATGGTGNDTLFGNAVANKLTGGDGNDKLAGLAGNDLLSGGNGNDLFNGGTGNDTMTGGQGSDTYVFNLALAAANLDRITDFAPLYDRIDLDQTIFTALTTLGGITIYQFWTGAAAHDASDRIIYNPGTGALIYDANGNAGGGAVQFAQLGAGIAVTWHDFVVIA